MASSRCPTKEYYQSSDSNHAEDSERSSIKPTSKDVTTKPNGRPRDRYRTPSDDDKAYRPDEQKAQISYKDAQTLRPRDSTVSSLGSVEDEKDTESNYEDKDNVPIRAKSPSSDPVASPPITLTPARSRLTALSLDTAPPPPIPPSSSSAASRFDRTRAIRYATPPPDSARSASPPSTPTPRSRRKPGQVQKEPPMLTPQQHLVIAKHTRTASRWRDSFLEEISTAFKDIDSTNVNEDSTIRRSATNTNDSKPARSKRSLNDMIKIHWRSWWSKSDLAVTTKLARWNLALPPGINESAIKMARREARARLDSDRLKWQAGEGATADDLQVVIKREPGGD